MRAKLIELFYGSGSLIIIMMKERPTKCIFKVNHIFRISVLLLYVSALQERHLQGAQRILMKLFTYATS
jgi:hypothetical protein